MKRTVWVAAGVAIVAAGCGGSSEPGEEALERIFEQAAGEAGEDVDIEFDDEGNFQISTDDGEFSIQTDADGNVTFEGESSDGEFSIESDDGVTVIESDEGTATISQGTDVPDDFPAGIPLPDGLTIQLSQTSDMGDGQTGSFIIGTAPGDWQPYLDQLTSALDGLGYTQQSLTTTPTGAVFSYVSGETAIFGNVGEAGDGTMTVQVTYSTN